MHNANIGCQLTCKKSSGMLPRINEFNNNMYTNAYNYDRSSKNANQSKNSSSLKHENSKMQKTK